MSDTPVPVVPVVAPVAPPAAPPAPTPGIPPAGSPPRMDGVPAPAVAPAAPAVEGVDDSDDSLATGNAALDAAIGAFVSVTGAKPADLIRAVSNAIDYQDANLIDRAFLREKFGANAPQAIALAEATIAETIRKQADNVAQAKATVHAAAGGEAQWNQAVSIFNSSASEPMRAAVKALMDQGNIAGGAELLISTVRNSGLVPNVGNQLNGGSAVTAQAGAMSAAQFQTEMASLRKEAGNRSFESGPLAEKYNSLLSRRRAGKQLGM